MAYPVFRVQFERMVNPRHTGLFVETGDMTGILFHAKDDPSNSTKHILRLCFEEKRLNLRASASFVSTEPGGKVHLGSISAGKLDDLRAVCQRLPAPSRQRFSEQVPNCVTWCDSVVEQLGALLE